jgi:predicted acetyltransferase
MGPRRVSAVAAVPQIRPVDPTGADLGTYYRVVDAAFGSAPDDADVAAKRPLVDPGRFLLAAVDGVDGGAAGSFPFDLTLPGGATVPVAGVSDVGVAPTHRRRGVLRGLMHRLLDDAVGRGEVAAVLNASEAAIYGRFGFGVATRWRRLRVATARVQWRHQLPGDGGSCSMVRRTDAASVLGDIYDRAGAGRSGWLSRSPRWWDAVLGDVPMYLGGGHVTVLVHHGVSGEPDGYALYRVTPDWSTGSAGGRLDVTEIVAADTAARLALWGVLLDHDLVAEVTAWSAPDEPLLDALVDTRAVRAEYEGDFLWLRPLDVVALLDDRPVVVDDRLVLDVRDGVVDGVTGHYELDGASGTLAARRSGAAPDLTLDVAELGSLVLGGGSARRLGRVGRITEHTEGALARLDRLLAVDPLPWCPTRF